LLGAWSFAIPSLNYCLKNSFFEDMSSRRGRVRGKESIEAIAKLFAA
jgi:hypothetical protein